MNLDCKEVSSGGVVNGYVAPDVVLVHFTQRVVYEKETPQVEKYENDALGTFQAVRDVLFLKVLGILLHNVSPMALYFILNPLSLKVLSIIQIRPMLLSQKPIWTQTMRRLLS